MQADAKGRLDLVIAHALLLHLSARLHNEAGFRAVRDAKSKDDTTEPFMTLFIAAKALATIDVQITVTEKQINRPATKLRP